MKPLLFLLTLLVTGNVFGQKSDIIDGFILIHYNKTLYDRTISNNSGGIGFGLELLGRPGRKLQPSLQVNSNLFAGTKEAYLDGFGNFIPSKTMVTTVFGGPHYSINNLLFTSVTTGAGFYNNYSYFGYRPSVGLFTNASKKLSAVASFTTILQR